MDIWDENSDTPGNWDKMKKARFNSGYADGILKGEQDAVQEGFNAGFKKASLKAIPTGFLKGMLSAISTSEQLFGSLPMSDRRDLTSLVKEVNQRIALVEQMGSEESLQKKDDDLSSKPEHDFGKLKDAQTLMEASCGSACSCGKVNLTKDKEIEGKIDGLSNEASTSKEVSTGAASTSAASTGAASTDIASACAASTGVTSTDVASPCAASTGVCVCKQRSNPDKADNQVEIDLVKKLLQVLGIEQSQWPTFCHD